MRLGLSAIKFKDHRTFDFAKTFGSVSPDVIPQEFNFDVSSVFPDQNADGLPNGCTAYTENDVASSDDKLGYYDDQLFTYNNTKQIEGVSGQVPVSIMDALKAGTVYGVKKKSETPDQALCHRRAPYFIVKKNPDYFDGLISAMWKKQGGLSVGTPWPIECHQVGPDGVVPAFNPPKSFTAGHCWEACGVKLCNGESRVICKSWQSNRYGDKGYCYFNRRQINDLLSVRGAGAFGQKHAEPSDIHNVQMTIIETVLSYVAMWADKLMGRLSGRSKLGSTGECPTPTPNPQSEPVQPQPTKAQRDLLQEFCDAIAIYEGGPHDLNHRNNNPGNTRFYPVGYAATYGVVKKDQNGFAIFKDWETGMRYLKNMIRLRIEHFPNQTIEQFMERYAPSSDGNDPLAYAAFICKHIGLSPHQPISQLLT